MHAQAGIPAVPYSQRRTSLEFDSFLRLYAEKRTEPWARRRKIRRPPTDTEAEGASSLPSEHGTQGFFFEQFKSRALATYVLGIEPPPPRVGHGKPLKQGRGLFTEALGLMKKGC